MKQPEPSWAGAWTRLATPDSPGTAMPTGCDLSDLMGAGPRPTRVVSNWDSEAFSDRLVLLNFPFFPVCSIFSHHTAWASLSPSPSTPSPIFSPFKTTTQPQFGPPADCLGLSPSGNNLTYLTNNDRLLDHYGISLALPCTDRLHSQAQAPHLVLVELSVD